MRLRHLVLVVALAGCESPVAPPLSGNLFILQSIAGVSLPAPYAQNPDYNRRVVADTIAFRDDGTGERRMVVERDDDPTKTTVEQSMFTYLQDANDVEITFICPPNASCIAGPHLVGTFGSTTLTISESKVSRHPLVFQRHFLPD